MTRFSEAIGAYGYVGNNFSSMWDFNGLFARHVRRWMGRGLATMWHYSGRRALKNIGAMVHGLVLG